MNNKGGIEDAEEGDDLDDVGKRRVFLWLKINFNLTFFLRWGFCTKSKWKKSSKNRSIGPKTIQIYNMEKKRKKISIRN